MRNLKISASSERKREAPSAPGLPILPTKKAKTVVGSPTPLGRPTSSSPVTSTSSESWEAIALDVEPYELVHSVLDAYQAGQLDKAVSKISFVEQKNTFKVTLIYFQAAVICGAIRTLKNAKWKPDSVLTIALIYLAKLKPSLFSTEMVTQALSVQLKRDPQHNFKVHIKSCVFILFSLKNITLIFKFMNFRAKEILLLQY